MCTIYNGIETINQSCDWRNVILQLYCETVGITLNNHRQANEPFED